MRQSAPFNENELQDKTPSSPRLRFLQNASGGAVAKRLRGSVTRLIIEGFALLGSPLRPLRGHLPREREEESATCFVIPSHFLACQKWRNPCLVIAAIGTFYLGEMIGHGFRHGFAVRRNDTIESLHATLTQYRVRPAISRCA